MGIRVLLVDSHAFVRESLATMLASHAGIEVVGEAADVARAVQQLPDERPDVVVLGVNDVQRGAKDAEELFTAMPGVVLLAMSLDETWDCAGGMLERGAKGFVLKDKAFEELPHAIRFVATGEAYVSPAVRRPLDLFGAISNTIVSDESVAEMLCRLIELRDPLIARHQRRVAEFAVALCEDLRLSAQEGACVRQAALMHDVGKLGVPADVLAKPGALASAEVRLMRTHCEAGYLVLLAGKVAAPVAEIVYQHHERCDGSGYPRGLTADQTLFGAKILAVADVVEAMLSARPYRAGRGLVVALEEIETGAGIFYDKRVSESCLRLFRSGGFRFTITE